MTFTTLTKQTKKVLSKHTDRYYDMHSVAPGSPLRCALLTSRSTQAGNSSEWTTIGCLAMRAVCAAPPPLEYMLTFDLIFSRSTQLTHSTNSQRTVHTANSTIITREKSFRLEHQTSFTTAWIEIFPFFHVTTRDGWIFTTIAESCSAGIPRSVILLYR
jgi:hypothetical protein